MGVATSVQRFDIFVESQVTKLAEKKTSLHLLRLVKDVRAKIL